MTKRTILVVDDDAGVRGLLRRVIENMGYEVQEAEDALTAMAMLEREPIDLALCDVRMPGHDGVWLVDQIVTKFPSVRVALATGLLEMDPTVTLRRGVVGYLVKPFHRGEIASVLERTFETRDRRSPRTNDLAAALEAM